MKYYTGVGSRETPFHICQRMAKIAYILSKKGYTGRSGSAGGADMAFERGALHNPNSTFDAYIPWNGFNGKVVDKYHKLVNPSLIPQAQELLKTVHPAYNKLTKGPLALHTRNMFQVLGDDLNTPSDFLICYAKPTQTGVQGGTNTAWTLAMRNGIMCYNLFNRFDYERLIEDLHDY